MKPQPKPTNTKKKPIYNGYKDKADRTCYYCDSPYAERHEVYGGANRKISMREDFQVDLCMNCHEGIHNQRTPEDKERKEYWQKHYQEKYENKLIEEGLHPELAREEWIQLIGRSYL